MEIIDKCPHCNKDIDEIRVSDRVKRMLEGTDYVINVITYGGMKTEVSLQELTNAIADHIIDRIREM